MECNACFYKVWVFLNGIRQQGVLAVGFDSGETAGVVLMRRGQGLPHVRYSQFQTAATHPPGEQLSPSAKCVVPLGNILKKGQNTRREGMREHQGQRSRRSSMADLLTTLKGLQLVEAPCWSRYFPEGRVACGRLTPEQRK